MWPNTPTFRYLPKRSKDMSKYPVYVNVFRRQFQNHQELEITQMLINWCMVLKNVIHACNSIGLVAKSCPTLVTPWTIACQVPLSIGFSRQEYWSGLPISFSRESSQPRNSSQPRLIQQKYEPQMQTTIRMNLRSTMLNEASLS